MLPTSDKAQQGLGLSLPQSEALFDSVWAGFVRQRGVEVQGCRKRLSRAFSQETLVLWWMGLTWGSASRLEALCPFCRVVLPLGMLIPSSAIY